MFEERGRKSFNFVYLRKTYLLNKTEFIQLNLEKLKLPDFWRRLL